MTPTERPTGPGPAIGDAQAQIDQIEQVVAVVNEIGHPRVKPIKKKLRRALARVGEGAAAGRSEEVIAKQLTADLGELRLATYQLLNTVVNQLRGSMRIKKREMSPDERKEAERLINGLGLFARAMHTMIRASRSDDEDTRQRAVELMNEAHAAMKETHAGQAPDAR